MIFCFHLLNLVSKPTQTAAYSLELKFHEGQVIKYGESGSSMQKLKLPNAEKELEITSAVKGGIRIAVASLSGKKVASIVMMSRTDSSQLSSPILPTQKAGVIPDVSYNGTLDGMGNLILKSDQPPSSNPALIAAPLSIVPLFAPLPHGPVSVGSTWQASDRMFKGLGLSAPGSVATFQLKSVDVSSSGQVAIIQGRGQVPVKMSADEVETAMASANMAAPAMNMSISGRVEWVMEEKLNLTTGMVESVALKTKTHLNLHLVALDAETTNEGTGELDVNLLPPNSPELPN